MHPAKANSASCLPSLIKVFALWTKKTQILGHPQNAQGMLRSDCAAQADLIIHWAHSCEIIFLLDTAVNDSFLLFFRSLAYNLNMTYFYSPKDTGNYSHLMTFTNTFNFSVVIYNVSLPEDVKHCFSVSMHVCPLCIYCKTAVSL